MNLYRFEVTLKQQEVVVVVAANDEETAFQTAEVEVERNFLKLPEIEAITLLEKKKIGTSTGFVLTE